MPNTQLVYSLSIEKIDYKMVSTGSSSGRIRSLGSDFTVSIDTAADDSTRVEFNERIGFPKGKVYKRAKLVAKGTLPAGQKLNVDLKLTERDKDYPDTDSRLVGTKGFRHNRKVGKFTFQQKVRLKGDGRGDKGRIAELTFSFLLEISKQPVERDEGDGEGEGIPPIIEVLRKFKSPILAVVSDVHIGDGGIADDFDKKDDDAFIQMLEWLDQLYNVHKEDLTLVINGDFLELWEVEADYQIKGVRLSHPAVTKETVAHYLPERYPDVSDLDKISEIAIPVAKAKVTKIVKAHRRLFDALAKFSKKHDVMYVVGNHDDDLLSLEVLRHFVSESGVIVNRTKPDKGYIENPYARFYVYYPFNVYCEHGHKTDTFNYASAFGKIPPGRYVTAFLSSFLERLMDGELGVSLSENAKRKYGKRPFARVDAIPNYLQLIHCLERDGVIGSGTGGDRPKQLIDEMNRRIDTIIDKKVAQDLEDSFDFLKGVATGLYDAAIGAIQVIKGQTGGLGRIKAILRLLEIIREGAVPTLAEAQAELKIQPGNKDKTQAVIMGHNHSPVVQPIVPNESIYINTGNWQDAGNFVGCQYNETRHRHVSILFKHSPHSVYAEQFVFFPSPQSVGWQRYNLKKSP